MTDGSFDLERTRLEIAKQLPAQYFEEFQRLTRTLVHGPKFQWSFVDASAETVRNQLIVAVGRVLRAARQKSSRLPLSDKIADAAELERRLVAHARHNDVVHVVGRSGWFDHKRWNALNARRERIAAGAHARFVLWLDDSAIRDAALHAPDLWAWRSGVYTFGHKGLEVAPATTAPQGAVEPLPRIEQATLAQRRGRIAEITHWLDRHPDAPDDLLAGPLDELGRLLFELGDHDGALKHWTDSELPFHRQRGDERAVAVTHGKIAGVLQAQGQLDEALRIYREEALPVYRRLGDARECAITQGRIADLLRARGELDEALRIYREEALPAYERLGDASARAATQGRIADVLQARGQLDEALRIRREEQLPVYERLGDVRARAITQCEIARLLMQRQPPDRQAARALLDQGHADLARLGLPEARAVAQLMQALGLDRAGPAS